MRYQGTDAFSLDAQLGPEGAKEVAQIAMQRRLGKLDKSTPGGKSKAPPMMVMRPMTGPPKTPR
jgi:hypothetical protein